jgi:small-conductance mechanosensitive channel
VFIPNSIVSTSNIVNLSAPTTDTKKRFSIGVSYTSEPRIVQKILQGVAISNPYLLGNPKLKIAAMKDRLKKLKSKMDEGESQLYSSEYESIDWGIKKWEKEDLMLKSLTSLYTRLNKFASETDHANLTSKKAIEIQFEDILSKEYKKLVIEVQAWLRVTLEDPELFSIDKTQIIHVWDNKLRFLENKFKDFKKIINTADSAAIKRIDVESTNIAIWLYEKFKDPYEKWKDPNAEFEDFGDSAVMFNLEFFVDEIKSERFERIDRVMSDLKRNVFEELRDNNIEIPFPQQDVWFRNEIKTK